ncbi:unnamed protein product [Diplocarpon coronariae]|uniref:Cysteine-rich transmembrane CYSTM domain-containing protein n=1 Tax=Diplocarpon coronariae TaxID=2795749 RepID=A0A218ZCK7_9HELO|nr:hypothetical protein JHW43_000890 [Diplocarpon mali]OWP05484.1 hypothetical protein B2J93_7828 [Marssonina coronariae]
MDSQKITPPPPAYKVDTRAPNGTASDYYGASPYQQHGQVAGHPPQGQYAPPGQYGQYPPQGQYGQYPPQGQYGQQGGYAPNPQMNYGGYAPQGQYLDARRDTTGAGSGCLGGCLAAMACCCCLDILF